MVRRHPNRGTTGSGYGWTDSTQRLRILLGLPSTPLSPPLLVLLLYCPVEKVVGRPYGVNRKLGGEILINMGVTSPTGPRWNRSISRPGECLCLQRGRGEVCRWFSSPCVSHVPRHVPSLRDNVPVGSHGPNETPVSRSTLVKFGYHTGFRSKRMKIQKGETRGDRSSPPM